MTPGNCAAANGRVFASGAGKDGVFVLLMKKGQHVGEGFVLLPASTEGFALLAMAGDSC